jgi:hypothetical protein
MDTTIGGNSMKDTQIKPNDIAVILRPNHKSGVEWDGDFEVLVSGFGPVTMGKEDIDKLIAMGVLLASVFPFMEKNVDIAHQIMEHCNKFYGDVGEVDFDLNHNSFSDEFVLTPDTATIGGKH